VNDNNDRRIDRETDALANMMAADAVRIDRVTDEMGDLKDSMQDVRGAVSRLVDGVDELRKALAILVRHEMRMERLESMGADTRIWQATADKRLATIEILMPQFIEARSLLVKGVVGLLAAVGMSVLLLVMKT